MALKNEGSFWALTRRAFQEEGAFIRKLPAEGFAGKGTPDGFFAHLGTNGVIELKYEKAWPKRVETTVPIDVTPEQWNWLTDCVGHGGRAFVLAGVEDDWFLLRVHELMTIPQGPKGGFRAPQQWLRDATFKGRLGELRKVPGLVAHALPTA